MKPYAAFRIALIIASVCLSIVWFVPAAESSKKELSTVLDDPLVIGSLGTDRGQFREPTSILPIDDSSFCVIDFRNHRISKWTYEGKFVTNFGGYGLEPGQLYFPLDICLVDGQKHLHNNEKNGIACIDKSYRIQYFSIDGKFLDRKKLGILPILLTPYKNGAVLIMDDAGQLYSLASIGESLQKISLPETVPLPSSMAYNGSRHILYIASGENCIYSVDLDHDSSIRFGEAGFGPGQFFSPSDLAISPDGMVLVTDLFSRHIQVFDYKGTYRKTLIYPDISEFQVINPTNCAMSDTLVFVSDKYRHRIIITPLHAND